MSEKAVEADDWPLDQAIAAFFYAWPSFREWWSALDNGYGQNLTVKDIPPEPFEAFLTAAEGWKTIESAPRDKAVLVSRADCPEAMVAILSSEHMAWCRRDAILSVLKLQPTHWMPLPDPPAHQDRKGDGK